MGLTDYDWYSYLKDKYFDKVNFWRPGHNKFKALQPNELFLFKLKSPHLAIVGGGFFVKYSLLPISFVWETFERKNGVDNYVELLEKVKKYREKNNTIELNPYIGCIVLTKPFFFEQDNWIYLDNWPSSIQSGKKISLNDEKGVNLYNLIQERLKEDATLYQIKSNNQKRFEHYLVKQRLGQGAFRVLVTDAYNRQCAVSGEKILPALEATHIKPYSKEGPNDVKNGILLRADIHKLFDAGYITITYKWNIEISKRLKEDFDSENSYLKFHGKKLSILPKNIDNRPSKEYLIWHNENVFLG